SRDHWTPTPRLAAIERERTAAGRDARRSDATGDAGDRGGDGAEPAAERVADRVADDESAVSAFTDPELRDPRHWVLPADQPDFAAATRLVRRLRRSGIEVHRLTAPVELPGGTVAPARSFVIHAAQAVRPHVRDVLEPQWHPDDVGSAGEPIRPYDAAGWTLSMQMGVRVERILDGMEFPAEPVEEVEVPFEERLAGTASAGWLADHRCSNQFIAVNRLLAAGEAVFWIEAPFAAA